MNVPTSGKESPVLEQVFTRMFTKIYAFPTPRQKISEEHPASILIGFRSLDKQKATEDQQEAIHLALRQNMHEALMNMDSRSVSALAGYLDDRRFIRIPWAVHGGVESLTAVRDAFEQFQMLDIVEVLDQLIAEGEEVLDFKKHFTNRIASCFKDISS